MVGFGVIAGNVAAGYVDEVARAPAGGTDFRTLFAIPMWVTVACLLGLLIFYRSEPRTRGSAGTASDAVAARAR